MTENAKFCHSREHNFVQRDESCGSQMVRSVTYPRRPINKSKMKREPVITGRIAKGYLPVSTARFCIIVTGTDQSTCCPTLDIKILYSNILSGFVSKKAFPFLMDKIPLPSCSTVTTEERPGPVIRKVEARWPKLLISPASFCAVITSIFHYIALPVCIHYACLIFKRRFKRQSI